MEKRDFSDDEQRKWDDLKAAAEKLTRQEQRLIETEGLHDIEDTDFTTTAMLMV